MEREYNRILKLSNRVRRAAEKAMRKLRMGNVEWSPTMQKMRDEIALWISVVKRKRGGRVCRKLLTRKEKKAGIYDTNLLTLDQALSRMRQAFHQYKQTKKDAKTLRDQFFERLSERRARRNNTAAESELKKLQNTNNQQRLWKKINATREKKKRTATNKLYRLDEQNNTIECFSKQEVEDACIQENKARFTQNSDTPFLTSPLSEEIGFLAETEQADRILQGTYQPPDQLDQYTNSLIQSLKLPNNEPLQGSLSTVITPEDNAESWKNQKETISSTGLHFGHFKAGAEHPRINAFDAKIRTLPYHWGFHRRPGDT